MAGFISMTTGPLVVSSVSVLPDVLMILTPEGKAFTRVGGEADRNDLVRIYRRFARLDRVDVVHPRDHLAEHSVFAVEGRGILKANEELRIGGIPAFRAGHSHCPAFERRPSEFGGNVWQIRSAR